VESSHVEVAPLPQADFSADIRAGIGNCVTIGPDFAAHTAPKSLRVSANLKRLIFAVINAWLVAPLPFPAAFILVSASKPVCVPVDIGRLLFAGSLVCGGVVSGDCALRSLCCSLGKRLKLSGAMTVNLPARSAAEVYRWVDVNVY
jgi:hypothetical protein